MRVSSIIRITSVYLLVSALICLFYLAIAILKYDLNSINSWVSIAFPGLVIGVAIFNNIDILTFRKIERTLRQKLNINGIICAIQVLSFSTDDFLYQYVQGIRLVLIASFDHSTKNVSFGRAFDPMVLDFEILFSSSNYTSIGVNLIPLSIAVFSFLWGRKYKEMVPKKAKRENTT